MKKFFLLAIIAVTLIAAVSAHADRAPWKWDKTLSRDDLGVPLSKPVALYWDAVESRYYVVDTANKRLVSFDKDGAFLKQLRAGNQLNIPIAMVRDPSGNLWVVDRQLNALQYVDLKEKKVTVHTVQSSSGRPVFLDRMAADSLNSLYVLDRTAGTILRLKHDFGVGFEFKSDKANTAFVDFKIKKDGLWALDQQGREITVFSMEGAIREKIALTGELQFPVSFDVDEHGLIYVLDRHQGSIVVFDGRGTMRYSFLDAGNTRGLLYYPSQIVFDGQGQLCVVNEGNGRVDIYKR